MHGIDERQASLLEILLQIFIFKTYFKYYKGQKKMAFRYVFLNNIV